MEVTAIQIVLITLGATSNLIGLCNIILNRLALREEKKQSKDFASRKKG